MFSLQNVQFAYSHLASMSFPDMQFNPGEKWLILGPSGCGKTTLLHLMAGLLEPSSGEITLNDQQYSQMGVSAMDKFRGRHIGLVFQQSHFLGSLTVLDNVLMAQSLAGKKRSRDKAKEVLERLGLGDRLNYLTHKLSIGEQQRASIARALINDPAVILADEPTSALDDGNATEVLNLLSEQASEHNSTLIIVTHDTRLKEGISNRIEL